jgi:hypothetical protein
MKFIQSAMVIAMLFATSEAITLTKCGCSTCPPCDDPADAAAKKEAKHVTKVVSEAMAKFVAKHEEL